jgi:hypothetical protein
MVRVFIFSCHPLFGQGVERLLCQETGLDIVGWETDVDKAFERIKKLKPDVVILESSDPAGDPTPAVMRILREGLGIKLVGLNLKDNTLCIYWGEQRVVKSIEDLVKAIEHSPPPLAWRSQADPLLDSGEY